MALKLPGFKFLAVALIVATAILLFVTQATKSSAVEVKVVLAIPDNSNLTAKLDGNDVELGLPDSVLEVKEGNHTLVITKPGYNDFSADFTTTKGRPLTVTAALKRNSIPQLSSLAVAQPADKVRNWQASTIEYFGNHDWAFAFGRDAETGIDGFFILQYDDAQRAWQVNYGPDSIIPDEDINDLPSDLQQYLRANNYTIESAYDS